MKRKLDITPKATADLIGIWDYTAIEHGIAAADAYVTDLDTVMRRLLTYPRLGADAAVIRQGYRCIGSGSHAIYYIAHQRGIEVMRVLHTSMDAKTRLGD